MNRSDSKLAMDYVLQLWPKWEPNPAEVEIWLKSFDRWEMLADLREAIANYYAQANQFERNQPRLSKIGEVAAQRGKSVKPTCEIGYSGFFVRCIEAPEGKPGYLGHFVQLVWPRMEDVPQSGSEIQNIAEKMRRKHEDMYGGRWSVVDKTMTTGSISAEVELGNERRAMQEQQNRAEMRYVGPGHPSVAQEPKASQNSAVAFYGGVK